MTDDPAPVTRWAGLTDRPDGESYQRRFDRAAARGERVHGEADLVAGLLATPSRILDAGCGTGRVAARLTALGHSCVGVDADASMIAAARRRDPGSAYVIADLAELDLAELDLGGPPFDLVVAAGNVIPLLAPGSLPGVVDRLAAHLRPGGLLVTGFGLDADHLPPGCPVTPLATYDDACSGAGLSPVDRWASWDRQPWRPDGGYAVEVRVRGHAATS